MTTNDTPMTAPIPETCRACTGKGHTPSRIEGRIYLIECGACEGEGFVEPRRVAHVPHRLTFPGDLRNVAGGY